MKKYQVIAGTLTLLLLCFFVEAWSAEDRISELRDQVSTLEKQKAALEAEKQELTIEGEELSHKIEDLKIQAKGGLGIIGKYRLSRKLRKAQALSEEVQVLEKKIHKLKGELDDKKGNLEEEYEKQIAVLLEKLNQASETEEKREILKKLEEYQTAKEQLAKQDKEEIDYLNIAEIDIKEYDGPQEIREKADLINDFANKLNSEIKELDVRVGKLQEEFKTRTKLGEFAEEISFFGERISKEEIAGAPNEEPTEGVLGSSTEETAEIVAVDSDAFTKDADSIRQPVTEPPTETAVQPPITTSSTKSGGIIMERNGVSASFTGVSLDKFEQQISLLEKRKKELQEKLSAMSEKAGSFYKKADEIEKSETKTSEEKR